MKLRSPNCESVFKKLMIYNAPTMCSNWDQTTYMPPGGAAGRARQMATLEKIGHARSSDPDLGELSGQLEDYSGQIACRQR